jgi:hypothetical protein
VQLTSHEDRGDAHRFYASLGFVPSHVGFKLVLDEDDGADEDEGGSRDPDRDGVR